MTPGEAKSAIADARAANLRSIAVLGDADDALREARKAQAELVARWDALYEERLRSTSEPE